MTRYHLRYVYVMRIEEEHRPGQSLSMLEFLKNQDMFKLDLDPD